MTLLLLFWHIFDDCCSFGLNQTITKFQDKRSYTFFIMSFCRIHHGVMAMEQGTSGSWLYMFIELDDQFLDTSVQLSYKCTTYARCYFSSIRFKEYLVKE